MINIHTDHLIDFDQAATLFPESHRPNAGTVARWASRGCRGEVLASVLLGWRRLTTEAAVRDFMDRLNKSNPARQFAGH